MIRNSIAPRCFVTAALLGFSCAAAAQNYPAKLVRIVVPFPPGGGDFIVRTLNTRLPGLLGQNLIIDNRGGAGGNIGAEIVAKARPDGYTLLIGNNSLTVNASLYRKLPYDPFRDFVPIAMSGTSPNAVIVHPSLPARSVKELIALAKAQPDQITFASSGAGTPSHLAGELFRARTVPSAARDRCQWGSPGLRGGNIRQDKAPDPRLTRSRKRLFNAGTVTCNLTPTRSE